MFVNQDSQSFYQYIDYTAMAEYLFSCIEKATYHTIEKEIEFLMSYDEAKRLIQEVLAGMLGVSAMAVQNALVQLSLKGAPATAMMTTNITRFVLDRRSVA